MRSVRGVGGDSGRMVVVGCNMGSVFGRIDEGKDCSCGGAKRVVGRRGFKFLVW